MGPLWALLGGLGEVLGAVDAPKIRNATKRMQHNDPKTVLLASRGGSVVCRKREEAQKKRKSKKDKKAKKGCMKMRRQLALVWGSASTQGEGTLN